MTDGRQRLRRVGAAPMPFTAMSARDDHRARAAEPGTPVLTVRRIYNAEQWNHIVHGLPRHDVRQGFEWGEVRSERGWRPVRLAALRDGDPVAAAAVLSRIVPGFGAILDVPRGPLFHHDAPEGVARLIEEVRVVGQRAGAVFARLSPAIPTGDAVVLAALERHGVVPVGEPRTTWSTPREAAVLDITRDEEELWRGLRRRFRHQVAAAPRHGIVVEASERDEDLAATGVGTRDLGLQSAIVRHHRMARAVTVLVARAADVVLGSLLAVRFGRRSTVLATSVRATAAGAVRRDVRPALAWELVRRARAEGVEAIDFGATRPHPSDPDRGLADVQTGLGCRLETFVRPHDLVLRPHRYRVFRAGEALRAAASLARHAWPGRRAGRPGRRAATGA
jgi:lipid II:glycine glycyltransferase (peptidoglycan interpeptide bridge formation enzyme)